MESIFLRSDHESQVDHSSGGRDEASSSSGHQSELPQESIQRISDALYKFYEPTEARSVNLDIFFFHALECEGAHVQNAHISSWRSSSELEEIWPQKWLSQDFRHARIISISYDCCTEQTDEGGTMDMYQITENLLQEIVWARKDHDCDRPMIFVGHGFGGVVMKQLCVHAHNKKENLDGGRDVSMFVDSIRGFFFYSTPHRGVEGLKPPGKKEGRLLRWMYLLNEELVRLHEDFCKLEYRYRWIIFGVAGQDSNLGQPGLRLREGSSRYGVNYITVTSSHFCVCRPSRTSNEYQHLQTLIQDVLRRVELERKQYLTVPKVMVGFDGLITEILREHLRIHAFVGVCDMGGVGKTTLAKLLFNKACVKFEFICFAEEIKGLTGPKSEMKRKVWKQMRHRGVPVRKADQVYEDEWYQVKGKSLLVIFDDVGNYQHPEILREIADDNGCVESRFILTSRNSQLLCEVYGDDIHIIRLDHLGNEDAKRLFTAHAFPREQEPPEPLRKIVQEVIDGCEGLPLTLEILGKHLRSRPLELWAEIPSALRRCTNEIADLEPRLWARLQLSYDGLPGNEVQNMFLDIASFFIILQGSRWDYPSFADYAVMAWSSIYGSVHNRLQTLTDRSLVTVRRYEYDGVTRTVFYMHEHLRRMGEKIAREKGRSFDLSQIRSSAWPTSDLTLSLSRPLEDNQNDHHQNEYPYDEKVVFQEGKEELGKIVAHRVKISTKSTVVLGQSCSFCIMQELWSKLTAIQFMDLCIDIITGDRCEQCRNRRVSLLSTLVLLRLDPEARLDDDYEWTVEAGGNSAGDLSGHGTLSLRTCASLVVLELYQCSSLGELSRLQQVRVLMIRSCRGAGNWPTSLGELRRLERLELSYILEPFELPVSFGHLTALQYLRICHCKVRSIPASIRNLTNLRFLEMDEVGGRQASSSESLQLELEGEVPDVFGNLEDLRHFRLRCSGFKLENNLVGSWGKLTNIESLDLGLRLKDRTSNLEVHFLESQRFLTISLEGQLASPGLFEPLPVFLTRVEKLVLDSEHASTAALARNMINLKYLALTVDGQQHVQDVFGRLQNLREFMLVCSGIENSLEESLGNMINLECLAIVLKGQQTVRDIFRHLRNLRRFRLVCSSIENNLTGSLEMLTSLEELRVNAKHDSAEVQIEYRAMPGDELVFEELSHDHDDVFPGSHPLNIRLKGQQADLSITTSSLFEEGQ